MRRFLDRSDPDVQVPLDETRVSSHLEPATYPQPGVHASGDNSTPDWPVASRHARRRMSSRRISSDQIEAAIRYGREINTRGATIFAIGRKEIRRRPGSRRLGDRTEGLQVVADGTIITAYRNRSFRSLRPSRRPCRRPSWRR